MPFDKLTSKPCIYQIRCLVNGKIYIGSTANLKLRWQQHLARLQRGRHHGRYLQFAWDKHGSEAFEWTVLEIVPNKEDLIRIEQSYLDRLRPFDPNIGYNTCPTAYSSLGRKATPETKAKCSIASTGRRHTPETKAKMSAVQTGRIMSAEARAKMSLAAQNRTPEHIAKINTPEIAAKRGLARRGKKHSAESRKKISISKSTPEAKAKNSLIRLGIKHTPEALAKMSAARLGKPIRQRRHRPSPNQSMFDFEET